MIPIGSQQWGEAFIKNSGERAVKVVAKGDKGIDTHMDNGYL